MSRSYEEPGPTAPEVEALEGPAVVEFGTDWCGFCQAAEPLVESALSEFPDVPHIKVADGPGRALGREFRVKLWPTIVFLKDGSEVGRVVRPVEEEQIREGLEKIAG
jgi:thioredoxin 1